MASIRKEIVIAAPPDLVWEAFRNVGAVHTRLLPDRVVDTQLEGDARILTFSDGGQVRELIVDIDEETRRLAYAVVGGARLRMTHHHASFQVFAESATTSRVVWITDVLPDALGPEVRARVEVGAEEMKRTLEGRLARR